MPAPVPPADPQALPLVDVRQVRRNFARAAARYREADFLAREIDTRMAERLDYVRIAPQRIADLGCGAGASLPGLQQRYPAAQLIGIDPVLPMLQQALPRPAPRNRLRQWLPGLQRAPAGPNLLAADALALPLPARSCGLLWSNLMLPWVNDPLPVFQEAQRVLDVGGLLMFSTLGPDTLKELRACFTDGYTHTQRFFDMHDLGDMLAASGFADPVVDMEMLTLTYGDFATLVSELRQSGAACAMTARRPGLTPPARWQQAGEHYARLFRDATGRLPATFEIIYGHAWKVAPKQLADGRAVVNFVKR